MTEARRNFYVGLFVFTALWALAVLMVWFGETPSWLPSSEWILNIEGVRDLSGIGEGTSVNLNGVEIGRVKRLEFKNPTRPDRGVVIICGVENSYSVPRGAKAKVYGATLGFGTGHVEIVVEEGALLEPLPRTGDAVVFGEMHNIIGELISKDMINELNRTINHIGNLTAAWTPVGDNLAKLMEKRSIAQVSEPGAMAQGITPNVATVVERLDEFVASLNAVLGDEDVQEDVKAAVQDIKQATEQVRETITLWQTESRRIADNVNEGIDRAAENLDESFINLNEVLENLDGASKNVARILDKAARGEGTAGLLAHDERLYEAAVLSLERFAEAMGSLQRILGKIEDDGYITVGKAPHGVLKQRFPVNVQPSEAE